MTVGGTVKVLPDRVTRMVEAGAGVFGAGVFGAGVFSLGVLGVGAVVVGLFAGLGAVVWGAGLLTGAFGGGADWASGSLCAVIMTSLPVTSVLNSSNQSFASSRFLVKLEN
jgi:MFS-type transporter involved in bile tolerance (Atg22 family)